MSMTNDFDSFSVCFNIMKIKYAQYDTTLDDLSFLVPGDKINVFINFESVLRFISTIKDVDRKVFNTKDFVEIMVSNIVNLAAHYRRFYRSNGLDVDTYLYMTDFKSEKFNEEKYNPEFRCYYLMKYTKNPKYVYMGDKLSQEILPQTKEIIDHIPTVYFIISKNIDSSVVPFVISKRDPSRKNLIISGDYIDTQYSLMNNFVCHYIRRSPVTSSISYNLCKHLESLLKKGDGKDYEQEINYYQNLSFYTLLFAMMGEQYRSVEGINNVGNGILLRYLTDGMKNGKITSNTTNISTLEEIFPEDNRVDVRNNFRCLNIPEMNAALTNDQVFSIESQLVNKFNHNGLIQLNSTRFYDHRFMLEELTM